MSRAVDLSMAEAVRFLRRKTQTTRATPCADGHFDCSDLPGGLCLDAVLALYPGLADEAWDEA